MKKLVQNQGAVGDVFKNQVFNLGETTSNRIELTFNKIESVPSKYYTGFMQPLKNFFAVLKKSCTLTEILHFLMSLKGTDISTNVLSYQNNADLLTPYVSSHLQGEIKKIE